MEMPRRCCRNEGLLGQPNAEELQQKRTLGEWQIRKIVRTPVLCGTL